MTEKSRTTTIQELLGTVINNLNAPGKGLMDIYRTWQQAVGPRIAQNTFPVSFRKGSLIVNVTTSVWMQELLFLKEKILKKLNDQESDDRFKDIHFKIGPVQQPPAIRPDSPLPDLSAEESARIEKDAACIEDETLRHAFAGVMSAYMRNKRQK